MWYPLEAVAIMAEADCARLPPTAMDDMAESPLSLARMQLGHVLMAFPLPLLIRFCGEQDNGDNTGEGL
jgi:hypothetical protein